jgi:hypothetical protein
MKTKVILFCCLLFLGTVAFFPSCSDESGELELEQQTDDDNNDDNVEDNIDTDVDLPSKTDDELVLNVQDLSSLSNAVFVVFSNSEDATVSDMKNVTSSIKGNHVTITSTAGAGINYVLTGVTANGSITFTSDNKFNLYLNGVGITNYSGAAINSTQKAVSVVIQDNTQNRLIDSENSGDKAAFYSKGKMDFSGNGILEVRGKAKHAIGSGNEIAINGGNIYVKEAASDAIHGDGITISGGTITAYATGEGFDADDTGSIDISGGTITIVTTGQKGHGIKTSADASTGEKGTISISGGTFDITTTGIASKAINSDGDITVSGGNLVLKTTGNACYDAAEKDVSSASGIKCVNLLIENNAEIAIKSTGSGGKGISADGDFVLSGGTLKVITTGQTYTYSSNYTSSPKGIKADNTVTVNGGTCIVSSAFHEGIEGGYKITVNGGTVESTAYDDGLNVSSSSGSIEINGGYIYVYAANNNIAGSSGSSGMQGGMKKPGDGIDSNGTITITGGVVVVSGGGSPDEAFDCDTRAFTISGGVIIGTGGQHSTVPTGGNQYSIVYGGAAVSSGEYIQLKNSSGESLLAYRIPRAVSDMKMILSLPGLTSGAYTLVKGGTYTSGTEEFHGYYTGGTYSGGTSVSFTISSTVTKVGNVSSSGGSGNPGGGKR